MEYLLLAVIAASTAIGALYGLSTAKNMKRLLEITQEEHNERSSWREGHRAVAQTALHDFPARKPN
jgi:hypothetical protein